MFGSQMGLAGGQSLLGLAQIFRGNRIAQKAMDEYKNNPYTIPQSAIRSAEIAGKMAQGTRMAGQDTIEENLKENTANAISQARQTATSPSQIMRGTIDAYLAEQERQQQVDIQAAQQYQQLQQNYASSIQQLAPYEVEAWKYNKLYPIQAQLNKGAQMQQAGWGNIGQGIGSAASTIANQQYLNSLGGQQPAATASAPAPVSNQGTMQTLQTGMMNRAYQNPALSNNQSLLSTLIG